MAHDKFLVRPNPVGGAAALLQLLFSLTAGRKLTSRPAPPGCPTRRTCKTRTDRRRRSQCYCPSVRPCAAGQPGR